ncbi:PD-(D/E)XK nuclease family protein [bacterium]|nr:PD-(D/E)XK nuclease family protein [bacterium]
MEQRWLNHKPFSSDYTIIYSDRSLSTAALRRLQEERVRINGWPNPGTFSFPQVARTIVHIAKASGWELEFWPQKLKPYQQLCELLKRQQSSKSAALIWQQYSSLSNLHKFDLDAAGFANIFKNLEDNDKDEFKEISNGILSFLHLKIHQQENPAVFLSDWDWISLACELLDQGLQVNWRQVLYLPFKQSDVRIWIPPHKELYPLEKKLLTRLSSQLEIDFSPPPLNETWTKDFIESLPFKTPNTDSAIFWAHTSEKPRPIETHELLAQMAIPLDIQTAKATQEHHKLRPLFSWINFHESAQPKLHPLLRETKTQEDLRKLGIDFNQAPDNTLLAKVFETQWPEDFDAYTQLSEHIIFNSTSALHLLLDLGLLKVESVENESKQTLSNTDPEGVPVLALEDIPFFATRSTLFWATTESLEAQLQADSKATLDKQLFENQLREAIEAEGNSVPDPRREALLLQSILKDWKEHLALLSINASSSYHSKKEILIKAESVVNRLSPTGIETYSSCPFRFYLDRLLKLPEHHPWDDPKLRATNFGTWIHTVLEHFFQNPDFSSPEKILTKLLEEHLQESFKEQHSKAFLSLIERSIQSYAQPLTQHILQFEKPLRELTRVQESLLETKVESQLHDIPLSGTIDRLDLGRDFNLLFDYKTGRYGLSSASLLKDAKFQWFLYRRIAKEIHKKPLPAGGYINPIHPDRSKLFFFQADGDSFPHLREFLQSSAFKVEVISKEKEIALEAQLDEILLVACNGLKQKNYSPTPHNEKVCHYCSRKALCGRPYLSSEETLSND